jgi:hypothetical protein
VIRTWLFPAAVMTVAALAIGAFLHPSRGGAAAFVAIIGYSLVCGAYLVYRVAHEDESKPSHRPRGRAPGRTH